MNRNARSTYLTYFGFLVVVLAVVGYSARNVIFRPWTARTAVAAAVAGDTVYLFGGRNDRNELAREVLAVKPASNTLKRVGSLAGGLLGTAAAAVGGRLYLAGGMGSHSVSDRIERFDPSRGSFTTIGRLPGPRAYGGLLAAGGRLYYLGGWDRSRTYAEIIEIDPSTGSTSAVGSLPGPREQFASTVLDGIAYVIGGLDAAGNYLSTIYAIDLATGTVVASGKLGVPAARMTAAAVDGRVFAAGGWNGGELKELIRIAPTRGALAVQRVARIDEPILDSALCALGSELYLAGGTEQRYGRQIQILRIDPQTGRVANVLLRSYAWW